MEWGRLRDRRLLLLAAVLAFALAVAAGCGGGEEAATTEAAPAETAAPETSAPADTAAPAETEVAAGEPIKFGVLSTCEGPFAVFYEESVGGVLYSLSKRGGTPSGANPSDGMSGASVAGHPIEVVLGCSDATPEKAIEEARRLVEAEGVNVLIGPLSGSEGIAVANYAKEQPGVTFLNGSSAAQDTTLKVQAENFFRWGTDGAQWMAGLGDYAYDTLGWRKVVTVADDYDFPYTQVAGFVAEFCSLGGQIDQRIWVPLGEQDLTSYVAQIPEGGADGFLMALGGTGTVNFVKQYGELRGALADKMVGGSVTLDPTALGELGDRIVGVVTGSPVSPDSTDPAWVEYVEGYQALYPEVAPQSLFAAMYYDAAEAALQSLEAIGGDLSDGHAAFRETMSNLTYESPHGTVTLDENRNAIADNFVIQAVEDQNGDGVPDLKTLKTVPQVDQTFAGFFSTETPTPDRESPECKAGTPPPWTSGG